MRVVANVSDAITSQDAFTEVSQRSLTSFVSESLDESEFTKYHWRVLALIVAGLFFDLFDIGILGSLVPDMLKGGFVQPGQVALIASATFLGVLVGSVGQGELTDRFGRKTVYQANLLIYGLATLAAATSTNYVILAVWRFVAGFGLGAEIPLAYAYAAEFAPKRIRGRVLSLVNLLGGSIAIPLGLLFALAFRDHIGWRGTFVVIGVAALIIFLLRIGLPESPRWLAAKGRTQAALAVLRRMNIEAKPDQLLTATDTTINSEDPILQVFRRYPRRIFSFMGSLFCISVGIYVIATWLPALMGRQGYGIEQSLKFSLVVTCAFPLSSVALIFLLDRFGRMRTVISAFLLASLSTLIFMGATGAGYALPILMLLGFLMAFFIDVAGNTLILMSGELFPTGARSSGGGLGLGAGRVGAILASYVVVGSIDYYGVPGVYVALSGILLLGAISAVVLKIDLELDPAGQSLEEIAN
jgi:MFS transporter, putative metabolite:H+ symporter